MSAEAGADPGSGAAEAEAEADGRTEARDSYRDNQQRLGQGAQVMGGVGGNFTVINAATLDEAVADLIIPPRLREGPYPADDVRARLRGFVEPPTYARCRKVLDSHILVLRAASGTGASTAAFALLAERYGADGITGLDSPDDLSRWHPTEGRGYLLQGLSPGAAASLSEVVLTGLAELLRGSGAHLIVTVGTETSLPGDTVRRQVEHRPPSPVEVASKYLKTMVEAGELTPERNAAALGHLGSAAFAEYLLAHRLPQDGIDVAKGLSELVASGRPAASVLENLRTGSPAAARAALAKASDRADSLALMAAIALLSEQDRTVLEKFSAVLRPHIEERGGPTPATDGPPVRGAVHGPAMERPQKGRDLLGPPFEQRLEMVGAHQLAPRLRVGQRYPVRPVVFSGRHRSEALLRCLWLDYEGMADLLCAALGKLPHHSGIELSAGQAIGKVLAHATGPDTLRQLHLFAASDRRWQRRLVAYALGEMVQHPALTSAVRDQLRQWSRVAHIPLRCTVAETCAGSYGLARPAAALKLLHSVLNGPDGELEDSLRAAVSFALSTLLSEDANHALVLDRLREWQGAAPGTRHHAMAVHFIEWASSSTFPRPGAPGERRVRLADLLADHPGRAFDLVVTALNDPATHEAMAKGLSQIESDPAQRRRTAFPGFLAALSGKARTNRGVLRFVLRRRRVRTASSTEGFAS